MSTSIVRLGEEPALGPLQSLGLRALGFHLRAWADAQLVVRLPQDSEVVLGNPDAERSHVLEVRNPVLFRKLLLRGDLGLAESYMDGDWETPNLVGLLAEFARHLSGNSVNAWGRRFWDRLRHRLRSNTLSGSRRNIQAHYDLGNSFYKLFLDKSLQYSSAVYCSDEDSLEAAQQHKIALLLEKLNLRPGMHLLEIGSGWGELAVRAAVDYGVRVTTVTLSDEQFRHVQERVQREGLGESVTVELRDYRSLQGSFDRVVSVEMVEAVGHENLGTYFGTIDRLLAKDGVAVIQAITMPEERYARYLAKPDFIQLHIFPGAVCPSLQAMTNAMARTSRLGLHELQNIGISYAKTLAEWRHRFLQRLPEVRALGFDERFVRMWEYYLAYCEAGFATRMIGTVQMVLTRQNNETLPALAPIVGAGRVS